ncbi:hypothetical protein JY651_35300 [Pyxidicoccus parkwayensis]|uniref:Holin n=1 Tax=Pyxidicoccus parkwayensis TaxID=2813578 RepID=A0ABX7NP67_9BACT|nr:hypothetical protein [Pyxidicoccus parkwaysis]QSQ20478.1 hypothetical protein JY651_35300 [Pyxidicoccus parkwaysis]
MSDVSIILIGALGSALQELLHWYGLREHLSTPRYKELIKSVGYWVITGLMILGSGVAVWAWFGGDGNLPARQYLIVGAALPLIFKKAVEAVTGEKTAPDTRATPTGPKLSDYFRSSGREERVA